MSVTPKTLCTGEQSSGMGEQEGHPHAKACTYRSQALWGARDKSLPTEEPCAGKLASTVLKQRWGERFPRLL